LQDAAMRRFLFLRTGISAYRNLKSGNENAAAHVHGVASYIVAQDACAVGRISASTAAALEPHYRDAQRAAAAMWAAANAFADTGRAFWFIALALADRSIQNAMFCIGRVLDWASIVGRFAPCQTRRSLGSASHMVVRFISTWRYALFIRGESFPPAHLASRFAPNCRSGIT
jgi:hypothetical protein